MAAALATDSPPYSLPGGTDTAPYSLPAPEQPATIDQLPATAPSAPQLPLIAALALPGHQRLGAVLAHGLLVKLYAYRPVAMRVDVLLPAPLARRLKLHGKRVVAHRGLTTRRPGIYHLRLVFEHRVRKPLGRLQRLAVTLRSVLGSDGERSTASTPVKLTRR